MGGGGWTPGSEASFQDCGAPHGSGAPVRKVHKGSRKNGKYTNLVSRNFLNIYTKLGPIPRVNTQNVGVHNSPQLHNRYTTLYIYQTLHWHFSSRWTLVCLPKVTIKKSPNMPWKSLVFCPIKFQIDPTGVVIFPRVLAPMQWWLTFSCTMVGPTVRLAGLSTTSWPTVRLAGLSTTS